MKVTFMLCFPFALSYGMSSWPALGLFSNGVAAPDIQGRPSAIRLPSPPKQMHQPQLPLAMQREARPQGGGEGEASGHPNPPSPNRGIASALTQLPSQPPSGLLIRGRDGLSPERPSPVRPARPPPTPPAANFPPQPPTHLPTLAEPDRGVRFASPMDQSGNSTAKRSHQSPLRRRDASSSVEDHREGLAQMLLFSVELRLCCAYKGRCGRNRGRLERERRTKSQSALVLLFFPIDSSILPTPLQETNK